MPRFSTLADDQTDTAAFASALMENGENRYVAGPGPGPYYDIGSGNGPLSGIGGASGPGLAEMIPDIDPGALMQFTGDQNVDATLFGSKWSAASITYSFPSAGSNYGGAGYKSGEAAPGNFIAFNPQQQTMARYAMELIGEYTGLTVSEITETDTTHATVRFSQTNYSGVPSAYANFPGVTYFAGDVWFGTTGQPFYTTPDVGNWGLATIMHEIGHAMGLKHGHQDYQSLDLTNLGGTNYFEGLLAMGSGRNGTDNLLTANDGQSWTLMTYNAAPGFTGGFYGEGFNQPQTFQLFDIAALQFMYGADYGTNSGNTTYSFNPSTGQMSIDGVAEPAPTSNKILRTIWDGDGIDTIDTSTYTTAQTISLEPGSFSTFSGSQLADHNARNGGGAPAEGNIALAALVGGDTRALIENVYAGTGADTITGNAADNTLLGSVGTDTLYGGAGNDVLNTGSGIGYAYGGDGNDDLIIRATSVAGNSDGGAGDDWFTSSDGYYVGDLIGGTGIDTFDGRAEGFSAFVLDLQAGTNIYGGSTFGLTGFEDAYGGGGNDTITGSTVDNYLYGEAKNDTLSGAAGNDFLYGGADNDSLDGGVGNDTLYGGAGTDNLDGGANNDRLDGGTGSDTMSGGLGNDRYIVDATTDVISGEVGYASGGGIDTVEAAVNWTLGSNLEILRLQGTANLNGTGNDAPEALVGQTGNNILNGRGGTDVITAKAGNDTLIGGGSADSLIGDEGADVFQYLSLSDSYAGTTTRDFLNGFVHGEDLIDLAAIDASPYSAGDQAFTWIGTAGFSGTGASSAGQLRYQEYGGNWNIVSADWNGDGTAELQIFVNLTNTMSASDFIL